MTRDEFDTFCASLKATTHVVQWRGASVWKIGGKIFALCAARGDDPTDRISFKCSDFAYQILREQPGIAPAPYLARAQWVQVQTADAVPDENMQSYLTDAYDIISKKLTKAQRKALGL